MRGWYLVIGEGRLGGKVRFEFLNVLSVSVGHVQSTKLVLNQSSCLDCSNFCNFVRILT